MLNMDLIIEYKIPIKIKNMYKDMYRVYNNSELIGRYYSENVKKIYDSLIHYQTYYNLSIDDRYKYKIINENTNIQYTPYQVYDSLTKTTKIYYAENVNILYCLMESINPLDMITDLFTGEIINEQLKERQLQILDDISKMKEKINKLEKT